MREAQLQWSATFKNYESLYCTLVTSITLHLHYTSIKKKKAKEKRKQSGHIIPLLIFLSVYLTASISISWMSCEVEDIIFFSHLHCFQSNLGPELECRVWRSLCFECGPHSFFPYSYRCMDKDVLKRFKDEGNRINMSLRFNSSSLPQSLLPSFAGAWIRTLQNMWELASICECDLTSKMVKYDDVSRLGHRSIWWVSY